MLFSSILAPSHAAWGPKIRLAPLRGLSLEALGLTCLVASANPPWASAEATPITITIDPSTTRVQNTWPAPSPSSDIATAGVGSFRSRRARSHQLAAAR